MKLPAPAVLLLAAALAGSCAPRRAREPASANAPERGASPTAGPPVLSATAEQVLALARKEGARATLVNVWATWCEPCREEFPALLRAAAARRDRGLRLVLVSADFSDQLPAVRDFLRARGVSDTTYIESGDAMTFINALNDRWSGALPATFVYDGKGRRVAFWEGATDSSKFAQAADRALSPHSPE